MNVTIEFNILEFIDKLSNIQKDEILKVLQGKGTKKLTTFQEFREIIGPNMPTKTRKAVHLIICHAPEYEYVELITKKEFVGMLGVGLGTWFEFRNLVNKYIYKNID